MTKYFESFSSYLPPMSVYLYNFTFPNLLLLFLDIYKSIPPKKEYRNTYVAEWCIYNAIKNHQFPQ